MKINRFPCIRRQTKYFAFKIILLAFLKKPCGCVSTEKEILLAYLGSLVAAKELQCLGELSRETESTEVIAMHSHE